MNLRRTVSVLGWLVLVFATLFLVGVFPFAVDGADAATGTAGAVTVTALPTGNLADGQTIGVHVEAAGGTSIFSLTGRVCAPGKVNGDHLFSYLGPFCPNVPVGQGDLEQLVAVPGAPTADLSFKIGTGTVDWTNERGFPYSLTCDAANPCDLVIRAEVTNSTVYFRLPLCFGTACPSDVVVVGVTPDAPNGVASPPSAALAAPVAAAAAAPADPPPTAPTPSVPPTTAAQPKSSGTSRSSNAATDGDLSTAQQASVLSVPTDGPSRGVRVVIAAVAGAVAAVLLVHAFIRARRQILGLENR